MRLEGHSIIVTGGERGIGKGIVKRLLSEGARVCIAGIDDASAQKTLHEFGAGEHLAYLHIDVSDEDAVARCVAETVERFGRLDAVISNAGIAEAHGQKVETLERQQWDKVIGVNLTGGFLMAKHAFPELRKGGGAMVLIASTRALQSEANTIAYTASKGGVVALTHGLAISGGPDIRVNCISPGWIHTGDPAELREEDHDQHPSGRVGKPEDIAALAAFLVSSEAAFITGQNFACDGGMTKKMIYV